MRRVVTGLFFFGFACVAVPAIAAESRQWIPLNQQSNGISIDYHSIDLKGTNITLDLKQQFVKPQIDGAVTYDAVIHRYAVDCDKQMLDRLSSHAYDARASRNEGAEVHPAAGSDHVPLANLKSLCIWRQNGFALPDITLDGVWEEMEPTSSVIRIFESPKRRQKKDGLVLFGVKNEFVPPATKNGMTFSYGFAVPLYQCGKQESNVTAVVLYDADKKPIMISFYDERSAMPKLDSNRERYAAACN